MTPPLSGIAPPLVTPLCDRDTLDTTGFECLIERVLSAGVSGLFVLGTTGEGPSLGYRLRREVVSAACRVARGRAPVLVGITDTAFVESVALARHAADAGAAAVVAAPPYYMPEGQPELVEYVQHLTPALPLPLYLYNMPATTKVSFAPETIEHATDIPGIAGIKDSSGDMEYFGRLCDLARTRRPDWSVLIGPEALLVQALACGAHGGVCGGANVAPEIFVDLYEAVRNGDAVRAQRAQERAAALARIYRVGSHPSAVIKGIKCALSLLGVCGDFMAEPFRRFRPPERARVAAILDELGFLR